MGWIIAIGLIIIAIYLAIRKAVDPPPPPKLFTCPYCGSKFATEEELRQHILNNHPAQPSFVCPYCGAAFFTQAELDLHMITEHPGLAFEILDFNFKGLGGKVGVIGPPLPCFGVTIRINQPRLYGVYVKVTDHPLVSYGEFWNKVWTGNPYQLIPLWGMQYITSDVSGDLTFMLPMVLPLATETVSRIDQLLPGTWMVEVWEAYTGVTLTKSITIPSWLEPDLGPIFTKETRPWFGKLIPDP